MTRRRRGLMLVGLALVLGGLAASDVSRRETALRERLAPLVDVVVARRALAPGKPISTRDLAVRKVPTRWAPAGAATIVEEVAGAEPAVGIARGADLSAAALADPGDAAGAPVRRGERAVQVVASGSPELVRAGAHVDVLVTREDAGTTLALQDVEVLEAGPAPADAGGEQGGQRVAASLRVTLRQAVYLTAAQSFARELRLLPRAARDRGRSGTVAVPKGLR